MGYKNVPGITFSGLILYYEALRFVGFEAANNNLRMMEEEERREK